MKEILAPNFTLNFSSGKITDFNGFKAWLAGPASQVIASTHRIGSFEVKETQNGHYQTSMIFDWNGLLPNGTEMTAQTAHTWLIVDTPSERFARIKTVNVELLKPFAEKKR